MPPSPMHATAVPPNVSQAPTETVVMLLKILDSTLYSIPTRATGCVYTPENSILNDYAH